MVLIASLVSFIAHPSLRTPGLKKNHNAEYILCFDVVKKINWTIDCLRYDVHLEE